MRFAHPRVVAALWVLCGSYLVAASERDYPECNHMAEYRGGGCCLYGEGFEKFPCPGAGPLPQCKEPRDYNFGGCCLYEDRNNKPCPNPNPQFKCTYDSQCTSDNGAPECPPEDSVAKCDNGMCVCQATGPEPRKCEQDEHCFNFPCNDGESPLCLNKRNCNCEKVCRDPAKDCDSHKCNENERAVCTDGRCDCVPLCRDPQTDCGPNPCIDIDKMTCVEGQCVCKRREIPEWCAVQYKVVSNAVGESLVAPVRAFLTRADQSGDKKESMEWDLGEYNLRDEYEDPGPLRARDALDMHDPEVRPDCQAEEPIIFDLINDHHNTVSLSGVQNERWTIK